MALRPLRNTVWGVPVYDRPYREEATIHTPYARQRKKMENLILVKEAGPDCLYVKDGDIVVLPEDHGGAVVTIVKEDGQLDYRYCFKEEMALATWEGALPANATEAGVINLED